WDRLAAKWQSDLQSRGVSAPVRDPLRLAQLVEVARGRTALVDSLMRGVPEDDLDLNAAYRVITQIPWAAIVTTNYDGLIERAFELHTDIQICPIVCETDLTLSRADGAQLLIKMHGDFAHRDRIIITEDDYSGYRRTHRSLATKVDQLLLEHPIVFVGFSLD